MGCCFSSPASHGPPTHPFDLQENEIRYDFSHVMANSQSQHPIGSQVLNMTAISDTDFPPPYSLITPDGHKSIALQQQPTIIEQEAPLRGWGETPRCLTPLPPTQLLVQSQHEPQHIQNQMQLLQQVISIFQPDQQSIASNNINSRGNTNSTNTNNINFSGDNIPTGPSYIHQSDALNLGTHSSFSNLYSESVTTSASLDMDSMFSVSTPSQYGHFTNYSPSRRRLNMLNQSYPLPMSAPLIQWPSSTYAFDNRNHYGGFLSATSNQSPFNRLPPILDASEDTSTFLVKSNDSRNKSSYGHRGSGRPRRKKRRKKSSVVPTPSPNIPLSFSPQIHFPAPALEATSLSAQFSPNITQTVDNQNTYNSNSSSD